MLYKKIVFKHNGENIRYYKLEMFLTLFNSYIIEREYGNVRYKAPTGIRKNYFETLDEAMIMAKSILDKKIKRGYYEKG